MTSEKQKPDSYPLTIFYDGACRICEREMMVYRRSNPMKRLDFVNINRNDFAPEKYGKNARTFLPVCMCATRKELFIPGWMLFWLSGGPTRTDRFTRYWDGLFHFLHCCYWQGWAILCLHVIATCYRVTECKLVGIGDR